MDDREIIRLFFERSEQAIAALSEKYGAVFYKTAWNILGDPRDAEECVNDALLGVWNSIPPQNPESLPGYVCRIVRNLAVNRYHANTAVKRNSYYDAALDEIELCFPCSASAEEEYEEKENMRALDLFLETLNKKDRILFVRRYWYAESMEDLASRFHTSRHSVSVKLSRIRKKLRSYLKKEGISL